MQFSKHCSVLVVCVKLCFFFPWQRLEIFLVIRALWKASSIPANVKKFFLSLAVSDLAVGLFAQLMNAVNLRMAADVGHNFDLLCPTILTVGSFFSSLLACASFLNVTAIAVDRVLAITLHLRYQELVTSQRVVIALVSIWITSGVVASLFVAVDAHSAIVLVICEFVWIYLDNSSVHSHLQSCKTSSESNPQSTPASKCTSKGTIPGEKVRLQCCVFLCYFCRMLSSEFMLYNMNE